MRFSEVKLATTSHFQNSDRAVYVSGSPGLGKTALAYEVAQALEIPNDRVVIFRPSLRDPVDLNA